MFSICPAFNYIDAANRSCPGNEGCGFKHSGRCQAHRTPHAAAEKADSLTQIDSGFEYICCRHQIRAARIQRGGFFKRRITFTAAPVIKSKKSDVVLSTLLGQLDLFGRVFIAEKPVRTNHERRFINRRQMQAAFEQKIAR